MTPRCPCGNELQLVYQGHKRKPKYCSRMCQLARMERTSSWYLGHRKMIRSIVLNSQRDLGCLVIVRDGRR